MCGALGRLKLISPLAAHPLGGGRKSFPAPDPVNTALSSPAKMPLSDFLFRRKCPRYANTIGATAHPRPRARFLPRSRAAFPRMAYKIAARPLNAYKSRLAASLREFSARQVKNYPKRIQNDSRAILGGLRGYFVGGIFPPVRRRAQFPAARGGKHMREGHGLGFTLSRSAAHRKRSPASRFLPLGFLRRGRPFA